MTQIPQAPTTEQPAMNGYSSPQCFPMPEILDGLAAGAFSPGSVLKPAELPNVEYRIGEDLYLEAVLDGEVVELGYLKVAPKGVLQ